MRAFSLLLSAILVGICLGAEQKPVSTGKEKEPVYQGKTLSEWNALAKDEKQNTRSEAAAALGKFGPAAIAALTELFRDTDAEVRDAAAKALKKIKKDKK